MSAAAAGGGRWDTVRVAIVTMGERTVEYVGDSSLTLARLLEEMGLDEGLVDVRVNGVTVPGTTSLRNGDRLLVIPRIGGDTAPGR